ncbi:uncharacterized protein LACBIDRAFT_311510 [Laccaria bicolor S238N-H82]|uniref:Predicted protein n=1 Tax=Laccaria bicolor (strain S238N-H82 / ATCC MYA-4686) TaxID=486041 RepID=B0CXJ9_LACBS|nr:uncharacterized protein LACBIDRAFT_311510 [Laccaria bicolor S238N-H82]EDR12274.1 predicted protein [Laccaria bicolor S238N-H82]|eukprot:XP_001876538.1 predicted protein [Laccaria bicolor S238N-H82]
MLIHWRVHEQFSFALPQSRTHVVHPRGRLQVGWPLQGPVYFNEQWDTRSCDGNNLLTITSETKLAKRNSTSVIRIGV